MFVVVDTETGGIGLDKSLLTASFFIVDESFKIRGQLNLSLRPDDGVYHVSPEALEINKIDLIEHHKIARPYKEQKTVLYEFLRTWSQCGFNKLTVVGKNVHFDLTHIWDKLISRGSWETFCSYQLLDLTSVWKWLELTNRVPKLKSTSLGAIAEHLGVGVGTAHTADGDVLTTINVLRECVQMSIHRDLPENNGITVENFREAMEGIRRLPNEPYLIHHKDLEDAHKSEAPR